MRIGFAAAIARGERDADRIARCSLAAASRRFSPRNAIENPWELYGTVRFRLNARARRLSSGFAYSSLPLPLRAEAAEARGHPAYIIIYASRRSVRAHAGPRKSGGVDREIVAIRKGGTTGGTGARERERIVDDHAHTLDCDSEGR